MSIEAAGSLRIGGDLEVCRLGYGAMRITGSGIWGPPPDRDGAIALLRRAVALGTQLIDTADSYGPEVSEDLIADALNGNNGYPKGLVIATKGGLERPGPGSWTRNGRPEHLHGACEASLRRLGLDCIDLYQLHAVDPAVPYSESVGALKDLQDAGKIRHVGVCNVSVEQLVEARSIVEVVSVQNRYNLIARESEDVLEVCERDGLAFLPWFPLAAGKLAAPGGPVAKAAQQHQATSGQIALAWLLQHSLAMLPIPGTSSVEHLEDNIEAAEIRLGDDELRELESSA